MRVFLCAVAVLSILSCGGADDTMRNIPDKFRAESVKVPNTPAFLMKYATSSKRAGYDLQQDWEDADFRSNVDVNVIPGSVVIQKTTNNDEGQTAGALTLQIAYSDVKLGFGEAVHNDSGYGLQSWKQTSGATRTIRYLYLDLYAHCNVRQYSMNQPFIYYNVQFYDTDKTTKLGQPVTVGGFWYSVDGLVLFDFSPQRLEAQSGKTYYFKVTAETAPQPPEIYQDSPHVEWPWPDDLKYAGNSNAAYAYIRYNATAGSYANGSLEGKAYNGSPSTIGDINFKLAFYPTYMEQGRVGGAIKLDSTPTANGEWKLDYSTPGDTSVDVKAWTVNKGTFRKMAGYPFPVSATGCMSNGSQVLVVTATQTGYVSNDGGASFQSFQFPTNRNWGFAGVRSIAWNGRVWMVMSGSNYCAVSSDCVTWVEKNMPVTASRRYDVVFSGPGGAFFSPRTATSAPLAINGVDISSDDGDNWTAYSMPTARVWSDCAGSYNRYTGLYCMYNSMTGWGAYATVPTGPWTEFTGGPTSVPVQTLIPGPDGFILGGVSDTGKIVVSDAPGVFYEIQALPDANPYTYTPMMFDGVTLTVVTIIGSSWTRFSSTDFGLTWKSSPLSIVAASINYVLCSRGAFVLAETSAGQVWTEDIAALGTIHDGDPITDLHDYYYVEATLSPSSVYRLLSPELKLMKAEFTTWAGIATHTGLGYEASLNDVPSLQATIDDFKLPTVGQLSLSIALTDNMLSWIRDGYPRNREVRVLSGYIANGFTESDFIEYFRGTVADWDTSTGDVLSLKVQDKTRVFKDSPVPATWTKASTPPVGDDKVWTDQHPMDVITDIILGYVSGFTSSKIDWASVNAIKAVTPTWVVSRTITGKTEDAQTLLEELAVVMGVYFIPQTNGKLKFLRWSPDDPHAAVVRREDMIGFNVDGNNAAFLNEIDWYFNINPDNTGIGGTVGLVVAADTGSYDLYLEQKKKQIRDYWTRLAHADQPSARASALLNRYRGIPPVVSFSLGLHWMKLEVGDQIYIPVADLGIAAGPPTALSEQGDWLCCLGMQQAQEEPCIKFQIVSQNIDLKGCKIPIKALRVA